MSKASEPDTREMDAILASIRRIIADSEESRPQNDNERAQFGSASPIQKIEARELRRPSDPPKSDHSEKISPETVEPEGTRRARPGKQVFVSYAQADLDKATEIVKIFEGAGMQCWIAPRDIQPGSNFNAEIVRAIDRCSDLLLLFSQHANQSKHVKRELYLWLEHDKPIVPVRLDNANPSDEFRYLLAGMQWCTATDGGGLLLLFS